MAPSIWQILIVAVLVVLLFGRGKISGVMGDVAKGIKSFKKGMAEDPDSDDDRRVEHARDVTPPHSTAPSPEKGPSNAERRDA